MAESVFNPCTDIHRFTASGECVPDILPSDSANGASGKRNTVGNWINRNAGPAVLHNVDLASAVRNILRNQPEGSILSQSRVMDELRRQGIAADREETGWLVDREISRLVWLEENGIPPEAGQDHILSVGEAEAIVDQVVRIIDKQRKEGGLITQRRVIAELMSRGIRVKGHESHITSIVDYELMSLARAYEQR